MGDEATPPTLLGMPLVSDYGLALADTPVQYWNLSPSATLTGTAPPPEPQPRIISVEIDGEVHHFEQPRDSQGRLARRATLYGVLDKNGNVTGYEIEAVEE